MEAGAATPARGLGLRGLRIWGLRHVGARDRASARVLGLMDERKAGVGLLAAAGGLVEDGAVDLGDDVGEGFEVESVGGGESEGVDLRLGEEPEVDDGDGVRRRRHGDFDFEGKN